MTILREIEVGQQVTLTIGVPGDIEGEYSGTVSLINSDKNRIQLKDAFICQTGKKFSGVKKFYLPEIVSVKINDKNESPETIDPSVDQIEFKFSTEDSETIERLITNGCTIESVGDEFDKALDDISHYHFVGLNADSAGDGRNNDRITFIMCSTPHKIYGFNMKTIGTIDDRFKELFESDTTIKVIHDASSLAENLMDCYGIKLKGIFDTLVVHRMLPHITLSAELTETLNSRTERSASKTAILIKVHDFLTEQLLKDVYQSFERNLDYCRGKDSIEVQFIYRGNKKIANEIEPLKCIAVAGEINVNI